MPVPWGCRVFSGRGLCVGLITRPEEFYEVWSKCDRKVSIMGRPWPTGPVRHGGGEDMYVLCAHLLV